MSHSSMTNYEVALLYRDAADPLVAALARRLENAEMAVQELMAMAREQPEATGDLLARAHNTRDHYALLCTA